MKLMEMIEKYEAITNNKFPRKRKLTLRLYDGFDNIWIDVLASASPTAVLKEWFKKTKNGTQKTKYADIDYFSIFAADTKMMRS